MSGSGDRTGDPGGPARVLARAAGVFLLAVPWLPLRRLFGPLEGTGALVPPREWALGAAVFVPAAWLAARAAAVPGVQAAVAHARGRARALRRALHRFADRLRGLSPGRRRTPWAGVDAVVLGAVAALGLSLAAVLVYGGRPRLVDGAVQLFQARIFAGGASAAPAPPVSGFFEVTNVVAGPEAWYSQYPPGHPALLAAGAAAGAAWAVPLALSLGTAVLLYRFAARVYGRPTAVVTLALLAVCPFFWLLGAGFMSHVPALFFASLLLWAAARGEAAPGRAWPAAAAGGALGALFLCRPLTAAALGAGLSPFLAGWLLEKGTGSRARRLAAFAAPAVALAALYLAHNAATTGHPLRPGYLELWGSAHGLGFHATPWGGVHTPLDGLVNELTDLSLLNLFLFEWPIPALLPLGAALTAGWLEERWDRRLLVLFLSVPAAYFFYWHRDALMGPRFLYAGLAALVPLTARALVEGARRLEGVEVRALPGLTPVGARAWAGALVGLCFLYAATRGIPGRFGLHVDGGSSFRTDVRAEARRAGLDRGLVFVPVSWGNRLIAELRGMGAPAGLVERTYRAADHCDLDALVRRARSGEWSAGRVARALERLRRRTGEVARTDRLNGDGSLRLRRDRSSLPDRCREEIEYDRRGWTSYAPHLPENDPWLEAPFVIARDLRGRNRELRRAFPDRPAYLYRDGRFRRLGPASE